MTIINDNMISLHQSSPSNDNLPVNQTQTIPKESQTRSTSMRTKSQQKTSSTQEDTTEDSNVQEPPNSTNENADDGISWEDEDNSDDDLLDIDIRENQN